MLVLVLMAYSKSSGLISAECAFVERYRLGCVGFEPDGAEVVSYGQVHEVFQGGR